MTSRPAKLARRLARLPLVHFLVGGGLLFAFTRAVADPRPAAPAAVVLTADDVARLRRDHLRDTGAPPSPDAEAGLVERAIEDEVLFREALARGLDRDRSVRNWLIEQMRALEPDTADDPDRLYARARALGLDRTDLVVRRMLTQKMRLLAAREHEQSPSDEVLHGFYARHAAEYRRPDQVTLWQVFVASRAPGSAEQRLAALRRAGTAPVDAARGGDAFAAPPRLRAQSAADLTRRFGPGFAEAVAQAPVGRWSGPIRSAYGAHLVWVESRVPGDLPPLDAVRGQLRERWLEAERARRYAATLQALKARYPLRIESAAWSARSRS